ncbi:cyanophycinase [uncultured Sphingomonas sp.]|uniref:cyanophycinase n=1 Tax=uncultured Sphingomonas sp. TaxID=158754 RepID=UPI0025DF957F|nr:cyanophycinase [uncultured Sphingomonas sp.]
MTRRRSLLAAALALPPLLRASGARALARTGPAYSYYVVGDPQATRTAATAPALMLVGGGDWDYAAFRWFAARAGHGRIVVLRASGEGQAGEEIYHQVGGVASVETIVFHDRSASSDPRVLAILRRADGIFLAGGDQANYVRYWKDSPVADALDAHVRAGRPLGGTSAGLAILGGTAYGAMDGGSIDSAAALADPAGPAVTLVTGFLHLPRMAHVVTDTHFSVRDRLGRLIAFVAKAQQADPHAVGLGVDEGAALCVEADGTARLHTPPGGHAWLVQPQAPAVLRPGQPLDWSGVRITGIGPDGAIDLDTLRVTRPAFTGVARVAAGRLIDAPTPG